MSVSHPNNSTDKKVLVMVVSVHIEARVESLMVLLSEYQAMCEAGFDPRMVLFTFSAPSVQVNEYLLSKVYCYRLHQYLPLGYSVHNASSSFNLPDFTRSYMANVLNQYDVFMYLEDDMILKSSHLIGYVEETKQLEEHIKKEKELESSIKMKDKTLPAGHMENQDYLIGFHRISQFKRDKKKQRDVEQDFQILLHERLVEQPSYEPICIGDAPYIHSPSHQAVWILTRPQVVHLQQKCAFLNQSSLGRNLPREYMSTFSLFDRPSSGGCQMTKVFPARHYLHFSVLHYFDGYNEVSTSQKAAVYEVAGNVTHGLLVETERRGEQVVHRPREYPECWHSFIRENNPGWSNETADAALRNLSTVDPSGERSSGLHNRSVSDAGAGRLITRLRSADSGRNQAGGGTRSSLPYYEGIELTQLIFMVSIFVLVSLYRYRNNVRRLMSGSELV